MSYIPDRKIVELTRQINEARNLFEQAVAERDQLRADLAAALALLRDCRSLVRCESLDHYRKADQHDGFGPCPIEMRMKDAIDAALAGKDYQNE